MGSFWSSTYQSVVPPPVSPGNLLQIHVLRLWLQTELETLGAGSNNLF